MSSEKKKAQDRAYHEANKEKRNAYFRERYAARREEILAKQRIRYAANKEKRRELNKAYRGTEEHKEKAREISKAWRAANPERAKNTNKEWYYSNIEKVKNYRQLNKARSIVQNAQRRAKKKGWAFDLTVEWVQGRLNAGCEVTGRHFEGGRTINSPSIDRKDSTKGYTMDNCRMVIWGWNAACNEWGEDELLKMFKDRKDHLA